MNLSPTASKKALEHLYRTDPVYCGLMNDHTTVEQLRTNNLTNEIVDYDDDRKQIIFYEADDDGVYGFVKNSSTVTFNNIPATKVKYAVLFDALFAGNIIGWCEMTDAYGNPEEKLVNENGQVIFYPENLTFRLK